MKRILASILVLSVLAIGLVGCGEKKADKKATTATPAAPDKGADKAADKK